MLVFLWNHIFESKTEVSRLTFVWNNEETRGQSSSKKSKLCTF
jgi:hypothetical protein